MANSLAHKITGSILSFLGLLTCGSLVNAEELTFENTVVRAAQTLEISAVDGGVIKSLDARLNAPVHAGETLVKLDSELAVLAVDDAKRQLEIAVNNCEEARGDAAYAVEVAKNQKEELERFVSLGSSASEAEKRAMENAAKSAENQHFKAYKRYQAAKGAVERHENALRRAEVRLSQMSVRSPVDGEVTRIMFGSGENVAAGEPLVEVRSMESMLTEFTIEESHAALPALIDRQVEVEFEVASAMRKLTGVIVSYDSEVNAQGMVRVHVRIDNQKEAGRWLLFHGKVVTLRVPIEG